MGSQESNMTQQLNHHHPNRCEAVSHSGFNSYFLTINDDKHIFVTLLAISMLDMT